MLLVTVKADHCAVLLSTLLQGLEVKHTGALSWHTHIANTNRLPVFVINISCKATDCDCVSNCVNVHPLVLPLLFLLNKSI